MSLLLECIGDVSLVHRRGDGVVGGRAINETRWRVDATLIRIVERKKKKEKKKKKYGRTNGDDNIWIDTNADGEKEWCGSVR